MFPSIKNRIQILDCTLRDGGFANAFHFGCKNIVDIIQKLYNAHIDIVELGFLEADKKKDTNSTIFQTFETLEDFFFNSRYNSRFAAIYCYDYLS